MCHICSLSLSLYSSPMQEILAIIKASPCKPQEQRERESSLSLSRRSGVGAGPRFVEVLLCVTHLALMRSLRLFLRCSRNRAANPRVFIRDERCNLYLPHAPLGFAARFLEHRKRNERVNARCVTHKRTSMNLGPGTHPAPAAYTVRLL